VKSLSLGEGVTSEGTAMPKRLTWPSEKVKMF